MVDTVGAGDAFDSVLLLGLARGWPLEQILGRAQSFASAVVGQRSATTNPDFYRPFVDQWHSADKV
ncbi:PfkB family carbohydrate kinase [Acidihalobacter ferrooxydans]|uniref:PfkB family carbohydrate kinase n=1 Tax=Acidihalobacter ferrooxydans TaxID=1765967 RepID=UPI001E568996|nr:PfkB family carbohydrate kinase [Acidihalobacter ferrooxydans]